ncbi:MAG: hypothetical protein J6V44_15230 [Methanobrevibacter sp.]|nr:hypothetical protein [Methanobrevibacter sp.]MBO7696583.1 hypothetical protein [Methanobrevibacter sp.]
MDIKLFEFITELQLEQDTSFYDPEYGNYRYRILNDISLLEVVSKIDRFNRQYSRKIVPSVIGNDVFVYL